MSKSSSTCFKLCLISRMSPLDRLLLLSVFTSLFNKELTSRILLGPFMPSCKGSGNKLLLTTFKYYLRISSMITSSLLIWSKSSKAEWPSPKPMNLRMSYFKNLINKILNLLIKRVYLNYAILIKHFVTKFMLWTTRIWLRCYLKIK